MTVLAIRHINIYAPHDLLIAVRNFYRDVLGLVVGDRPPFHSKGFWLYAGEDPIVHLVFTTPGDERVTHANTTLDHIAFGCDDYAGMRSHLDALRIDYRSTEVPLIRQRQLFFRDPAGNGVELLFPD